MVVTNSGDANNLTGKGAPSPKLVIPNKNQMDPATLSMALAVEQWANNLVAPDTGITDITSTDGSINVTGPSGPTTNLELTNPITQTDSPMTTVIETTSAASDVRASNTGGFPSYDLEATPNGAFLIISGAATSSAFLKAEPGIASLEMQQDGTEHPATLFLGTGGPSIDASTVAYMLWFDGNLGQFWWAGITAGGPVPILGPGYLGITTGAPSGAPAIGAGGMYSAVDGSIYVWNGAAWTHIT